MPAMRNKAVLYTIVVFALVLIGCREQAFKNNGEAFANQIAHVAAR
jgi:hypothetical protein